MFWGQCEIAKCSIAKGHDHCGQCQDLPCARLNEYVYDPEQGDSGQSLLRLRSWNEIGYDAWRRERADPS